MVDEAGEKAWVRRCWEKYSRRKRNRSRDFVEKVTTEISRRFGEYLHVFEDIDKAGMINGYKAHNRAVHRMGWKMIIRRLSDKAYVGRPIDPRYTSQTCPKCGSRNASYSREEYICMRCGLKMNRQLLGALNVYMRFKNVEPSPETFEELTRNIGDGPNIFIDVFPRRKNVQNIVKKCQRLLGIYQPTLVKTPNNPSPLDVGLSPPTLQSWWAGSLPNRGRGGDKAPNEPKKGA